MRQRITRDEGERYLQIGLAAAGPGDSEDRARLLVARSFEPSAFREVHLDEEDLERARRTGEEAAAIAERLGRVDLQSAALDGIATVPLSWTVRGDGGPVQRRRARVSFPTRTVRDVR
jgi:hypothetical protein